MKLISVIMPTKNSGRFIQRALDSLKRQTEEYELLVCDAGSTDNTLDILKEFGVTPISYSDRNWSDGVNKAIAVAKGDIIIQLMSDDELLGNALTVIREFFDQNNPEWMFSPCDLLGMNQSMGLDGEVTMEKMLANNMIPGMAVAFRPEFFKKYGLFDVDEFPVAADYEMWLRAIYNGSIPQYLPVKWTVYHAHGDNNGLKPEGWTECLKMRAKYHELWNNKQTKSQS